MTEHERQETWETGIYLMGKGNFKGAYECSCKLDFMDKDVVVIKGRKIPKGTKGKVFWVKTYQHYTKVGFKDAEGQAHFTYIENIKLA